MLTWLILKHSFDPVTCLFYLTIYKGSLICFPINKHLNFFSVFFFWPWMPWTEFKISKKVWPPLLYLFFRDNHYWKFWGNCIFLPWYLSRDVLVKCVSSACLWWYVSPINFALEPHRGQFNHTYLAYLFFTLLCFTYYILQIIPHQFIESFFVLSKSAQHRGLLWYLSRSPMGI